jgi:hypothetical protein
MVRRGHARAGIVDADQRRGGVFPFAVAHAAVEGSAGEHDLHLDRAVHAEDPVETVDVVADPGVPRHHELAAAARVARGVGGIGTRPEDAKVALVHADGVFGVEGFAGVGTEDGVEEVRVLGDVAVGLERLREGAEVVLADVEGRAPRPVLIGDAVRHVDLGE